MILLCYVDLYVQVVAQHVLLQLQTLHLAHLRRLQHLLYGYAFLLLHVDVFSWELSGSFGHRRLVDFFNEIGVDLLYFLLRLLHFSGWFCLFGDRFGLYFNNFLYFWGFVRNRLYLHCDLLCFLLWFSESLFLRGFIDSLIM